MKINGREIQCPRCGTVNVKQTRSDTGEYECEGKCAGKDSVAYSSYFQYDADTEKYAWPNEILYVLHADEIEHGIHRGGKIKPEIC